jgi:hypothetical protein
MDYLNNFPDSFRLYLYEYDSIFETVEHFRADT